MYTVIKFWMTEDGLGMECYGPFKTKAEAKKGQKAVKGFSRIEMLWAID